MSATVRGRWGVAVALVGAVLLAAFVSPATRQSETPPDSVALTVGSPAAAGLLRQCDLASAEASLQADRVSVVALGLAAHACNEHQRAVDLLTLAAEPGESLEDWRLLALAQSAAALEQLDVAHEAADLLLSEHPHSPLRPLAYVHAVETARTTDNDEHALALVRESRRESFPVDIRADLDIHAWEIATASEQDEEKRQAARHLLLHSPADAADLDVVGIFRDDQGDIPWATLFTPAELLLRSASLLDVDLAEAAVEALGAVPESARAIDWHLLHGQALVEARRGLEAIDQLENIEAPDPESGLDLEWLRAMAALDAATARRGRQNLPSVERRQMQLLAHGHLWWIVERGGDAERASDALRLLFEELADGEHFEQVRSILHQLHDLDPDDTSGSRYLWQLGWGDYRQRDLSGAIGYWSELADIYAQTKIARAGRYWSARAHEALGNETRAETLYQLLASAPSTDYYGKLAHEQLGVEPQRSVPLVGNAESSWPLDPKLERAGILSEAGLDELAMRELDLLSGEVESRAEHALRSRILARQGRRRESIQQLWHTFPVLGGAYQDDVPPEALPMYYPIDYLDIVKRFAQDNKLEVSLLLAMIRQESAFDVRARSRAGARGLMQVMPATGEEMATRMGLRFSTERLNDPSFSVQLGSRYFRRVLDMFDGNLELALAGYNAGPYRIRRLVRDAGPSLEIDTFLEELRYEESKTYVKRIVLFSDSYRRLYPDIG